MQMPSMQNRIVFFIPVLIFLHAAWIYTINIPFWDDYSVVLLPAIKMHEALERGDMESFIGWLFQPNAGHLPMLTHAIAWLQVQAFGGIDFRWSTIIGDIGIVLTVAVLTRYFIKTLQVDFYTVIPVPFLLLAFTHWESMDFMVPAWQFYWGSTLLPVLVFIAVTEGYWICAGLAFASALFLSSGALGLCPLVIAYGLWRKQWRGCLVFTIICGLNLLIYFYYLPPASVEKGMPDVATAAIFILSFLGSAIPNPSGHLYPLMFFHVVLGIAVFVAGVFLVWKSEKGDALKLTFVYMVMLALMALAARGYSVTTQIPSRYAVFSLLAIVCIYGLWVSHLANSSKEATRTSVTAVMVASMVLWVYSAYSCRQLLEMNNASRIVATQSYLRGNEEVLASLLWDKNFGQDMLYYAKRYGIYDLADSGIR